LKKITIVYIFFKLIKLNNYKIEFLKLNYKIMASSKRQFDDFTKFGGKIKDGIYVYPSLYHIDMNKNKRKWNIYIRLIEKKTTLPEYKFDWDINLDKVVPIINDYLEDKPIPENVISQVWMESGVVNGKISRYAPTYPKMVNKGRLNERNQLKQALVLSRNEYLKQKKKGGRTKEEFSEIPKSTRYFPMLARNYKDELKYVKYPAIIQPKLDGMRCVIYLDTNPNKNPTYKNVILYSRNKNDIEGFEHIRKELLEPLKGMYDMADNESIYLDGEFYKHGSKLQEIVGEVRNIEKNTNISTDSVKFYMFDCFYPSKTSMTYNNRLKLLDDFFKYHDFTWIVKVPYHIADSEKECDKLLSLYIDQGYEGIMYKNVDAPYLTHLYKTGTHLRSRGVLKRKQHYSDEYEIYDFTQGTKGKDRGAILWILKNKKGIEFTVTPKNMTYKERYKFYTDLSKNNKKIFKQEYLGKPMTVEYEDISENGVPLRAKAILKRDYE